LIWADADVAASTAATTSAEKKMIFFIVEKLVASDDRRAFRNGNQRYLPPGLSRMTREERVG
jgi:hypothetical protein